MAEKATGDNSAPTQNQGDSEPKAADYVSRDELNQIVNSAISSRTKSFEKKLDDFMTRFTAPATQQSEPEERVKQTDLQVMKKQLDAIKAERDAEITKRKDTDLRNTIKEQLLKSGVSTQLVKAATAQLILEDKSVAYNENNEIVFKTFHGEEQELSSGLRTWLKSDDGKAFLPPKGASGSGDRNYQNNQTSKQSDSKDSLAEKLINWKNS